MSILIKGMEMPNSCGNCPLRRSNENRVWCSVIGGYIDFSKEYDCRRDDCPIIEIPTPHGRLIDADKFEFEMNDKLLVALTEKYGEEEAQRGLHFSFRDCICNIQCQSTVIEAEGSE